MKKFLLPTIVLFSSLASAQTPTAMQVHLTNGQTVEYPLSDIDRLTFSSDSKPEEPELSDYAINVPQSFASSYVQKVMANGKQVAEIALEYIKAIDKQVTVVYPCDENGKADLTKGVTTTGASVVWDLDKNTATVGDEDSEAATVVYLVDGAIQMAYSGAKADATVEADVIVDRRGTQTETYTIVKIGTQYWMAENLRATNYRDGSAITAISETDETDAWTANTTGAYLIDGNADWVKTGGLLYNGFCVTNEKGIAPAGWEVPTQAQLTQLRTAGNLKAVNFKSDIAMTWSEGATGNNMTGFSAIATGYYTTTTGVNAMLSETYLWSSTKYYDAFSRADNLDTLRITSTTTGNVVVSSSTLGGHNLQFGHAIRCIRK